MSEHNLEEFEYSRGDLRIRLKKPSAHTIVAAHRPAAEIIVPAAVPALAPQNSETSSEADLRGGEDLFLVKSPIVGTFYASPSPGAEPFVKVGQYVESGQPLCIVEAMNVLTAIFGEFASSVSAMVAYSRVSSSR